MPKLLILHVLKLRGSWRIKKWMALLERNWCSTTKWLRSLPKKHKNTKRQKHCQFISKVVSSELLKMYRLEKHLHTIKIEHIQIKKNCLGFRRKLKRNRSVERLQEKVRVFLERENNSNNSRGKRHSHAKKTHKKTRKGTLETALLMYTKNPMPETMQAAFPIHPFAFSSRVGF